MRAVLAVRRSASGEIRQCRTHSLRKTVQIIAAADIFIAVLIVVG
jgi:hypothetical protein